MIRKILVKRPLDSFLLYCSHSHYHDINPLLFAPNTQTLLSIPTKTVGYIYSSPRKENNSKPPTGENVVPHERIIRVNPNRRKQVGIPKKESLEIENPKGNPIWRQTELILRCQRENSNEDPSWRQKELFPRPQRKQKGIPKKESLGVFIP